MQERVRMLDEPDSFPLWTVKMERNADSRTVAQALLNTARAQSLVHDALLALGAVRC